MTHFTPVTAINPIITVQESSAASLPRLSRPALLDALKAWEARQDNPALADSISFSVAYALRDFWMEASEINAFVAARLDHYAALAQRLSIGGLRDELFQDWVCERDGVPRQEAARTLLDLGWVQMGLYWRPAQTASDERYELSRAYLTVLAQRQQHWS